MYAEIDKDNYDELLIIDYSINLSLKTNDICLIFQNSFYLWIENVKVYSTKKSWTPNKVDFFPKSQVKKKESTCW